MYLIDSKSIYFRTVIHFNTLPIRLFNVILTQVWCLESGVWGGSTLVVDC